VACWSKVNMMVLPEVYQVRSWFLCWYLQKKLGEFVGDFSLLEVQSFLFDELMSVILTIEHSKDAGYGRLWLESDSILVCQAFILTQLVSCSIRGRWNKCLSFL